MAPVFHIALRTDWEAAQRTGAYTVSTRDRSLAEVGFIHASRADQWTGVRDRFYADVTEPLVLLEIDTRLLDVPVVEEPAAPGAEETFPHIYGRLPVSAVVRALPLGGSPTPAPTAPTAPKALTAPTAPATAPHTAPSATPRASGSDSFTRVYFREVFFNVALVCLVLLAGTAGMLVGQAAGDLGAALGGCGGLLVGGVVAVAAYRRRHRAPV